MRMVAKCQGVTLESRVHELGCELITLTIYILGGDLFVCLFVCLLLPCC